MLIKPYFYGLYVVVGNKENGVLLVYKRRNTKENEETSAYKHSPYSYEYDLVDKCDGIEECETQIVERIKQDIYRGSAIPGHEIDDILNGILASHPGE